VHRLYALQKSYSNQCEVSAYPEFGLPRAA
jgi:hypothetical protein